MPVICGSNQTILFLNRNVYFCFVESVKSLPAEKVSNNSCLNRQMIHFLAASNASWRHDESQTPPAVGAQSDPDQNLGSAGKFLPLEVYLDLSSSMSHLTEVLQVQTSGHKLHRWKESAEYSFKLDIQL